MKSNSKILYSKTNERSSDKKSDDENGKVLPEKELS